MNHTEQTEIARPAQEGGQPMQPPVPPHADGPRPGSGRSALLLLGCAAVVLGGLGAFTVVSRIHARAQLETDTLENSVSTVSVVHPKREPQQIDIELPGNVQAFEESPIYARANGYLKRWLTDIGAHVEEGQLLAEIETPELDQERNQAQAAVAQAKANLEIARISADRWQKLLKTDSVAQQDTDEKVATLHAREADLNAADANVRRLNELTGFKQLLAPFAGIITIRTVDVGTLITAASGREIFRLAKIDPLRVYINLPQAYSQMVKAGDEATLTFTELPGQRFPGKVVRTAGAIDPVARTLLTEVDVPNHDGKLFPGAHTMVRLNVVSAEIPVTVPVNTLLFRNEQGMQVGVVESNSTVRLANVTVGRDYGTTVEIVHGLSDGDNVIINPSDSLENGAQVRLFQPHAEAAK
jgi:RND family efflux transporter MFP subunit